MVEKISFFVLFCFGVFCCHFKILFTQLFNLHQKIDYSCVRLFDTCVQRQRSQGPTYNTLYFLFSSKFNVRINWNNLNLDFLAHLVLFFSSLYMCAEHTEIQRKNEIIFKCLDFTYSYWYFCSNLARQVEITYASFSCLYLYHGVFKQAELI